MNNMVAERIEIESEVNPVLVAAQNLSVVDEVTFTQALELGKACSVRIKLVEEKLGPAKRKTYEAYQEVMKLMKSFIDPLEGAKKLLASRAYSWQKAEEDRKRREAEEARRQAEMEAAQKRKAEEESRLALAERLEKEGMTEQAAEILETPIEVIVAEIAVPIPKVTVAGTSTRENWQFEVVDEALLPREFLMPDTVKIGRMVKMMKGETRITGIRVYDAGTVSFRG
jgi:hypothetical protein